MGSRPRHEQTGEAELRTEVPHARGSVSAVRVEADPGVALQSGCLREEVPSR